MAELVPNRAALPGEPEKPLILVPVTAEDVARQQRKKALISIAALLLILGAGWFVYKRVTNPAAARQAFDSGVRLLTANRYEESILNFSRTIDLEPSTYEAYRMRARAYVALSKLDPAVADFTRVIQMHPDDPAALVERGFVYLDEKDYAHATADANAAIAINSRLARAYNLRGTAVRALGDPQKAVADFTRAVSLQPNLDNYFQRASTYQLLDQHALALADFDRAMEYGPDEPHLFFARAESRAALGDVRGAREDIQAGRKLDGW